MIVSLSKAFFGGRRKGFCCVQLIGNSRYNASSSLSPGAGLPGGLIGRKMLYAAPAGAPVWCTQYLS